jgi:hypothetical protein
MIKVSPQGKVLVWLNSNFAACEREFPIILSSVSQFMFTQKIVSILADLIELPKKLETKSQLLGYLAEENNKTLCLS